MGKLLIPLIVLLSLPSASAEMTGREEEFYTWGNSYGKLEIVCGFYNLDLISRDIAAFMVKAVLEQRKDHSKYEALIETFYMPGTKVHACKDIYEEFME